MSATNVSVAICQLPTCQFSAFGKKAVKFTSAVFSTLYPHAATELCDLKYHKVEISVRAGDFRATVNLGTPI